MTIATRRVLLLMTTQSYRAGAFLEAAGRMGVPVTVGSDRPQALAALHPAGHLTLDFCDSSGAARAIVEFATRVPLAAVIAADDEGALIAAMAAESLGLDHHPAEAVSAARDKRRMRERFAAAGIPGPQFEAVALDSDPHTAARRARYPCVLKPVALAASRGVIRANHEAEFVAAFRRIAALLARPELASCGERARELLVEEFVPGDEVALEGLVANGRLRTLAIFDKPDPLDGPFFEETLYVTPSRHSDAAQQMIVSRVQQMVEVLGLRHGPVHAELRILGRDVWPLEIAPRPIGGLCSRALRFGDGVSLEELILRAALGIEGADLARENRAAGVMMIPIPRGGVLKGVTGEAEAREVPGFEDLRLTVAVGQKIEPLPEGSRYLGFIFARDDSPERVEAALRESHRRLTFRIEPVSDLHAAKSAMRRGDETRRPEREE